MLTGTVLWFDEAKGYGLIAPADGSPDVFVSQRSVDRSGLDPLLQGQTVSFAMATENGRPMAINISVVE